MLRIGWASREFTPDRPAMIQGQKHRRVGERAIDPLTVNAFAIESPESDSSCLFLSCDLAFISDALLERVREGLSGALDPRRVVMSATHTHTSLVIEDGHYPHPGGNVMTPRECMELVAERAVEAGLEAWESRKPRIVGHAFGRAVVGYCRYALYADGHAQMYGLTNREDFVGIGGYEDHSLDILFTWEPDGKLAGVVVAIPCPSQVDEPLSVFSADYWHEVRTALRREFGEGLGVLPLCSASGDQSPHPLLYKRQEEEMRERRGVTERQEIAERVVHCLRRCLDCTKPITDDTIPFNHISTTLKLPPIRITLRHREWAEQEYKICEEKGIIDYWWAKRLKYVIDSFDGKREQGPIRAEVHTIRIADLAIATNPFELFLDYGLRIKARSPASHTFVIQLCGRGMYLPTERALKAGGYGANPVVCFVGSEGGDRLVEETLRLIHILFED